MISIWDDFFVLAKTLLKILFRIHFLLIFFILCFAVMKKKIILADILTILVLWLKRLLWYIFESWCNRHKKNFSFFHKWISSMTGLNLRYSIWTDMIFFSIRYKISQVLTEHIINFLRHQKPVWNCEKCSISVKTGKVSHV